MRGVEEAESATDCGKDWGGMGMAYVGCVLCLWVLLMRCLYADEAPVSMRQPDTDTVYSPRVCRNCMGSALYVDCVCVSSMCVKSGRLVYVRNPGRPLKTLHTISSALIGWALRKAVNNTT